jgi:hypothetical protein
MTFKETLWFVLRLSLWCVFIVWPSYLLEVAIVAAFRQRTTPPFSTAVDVAIFGLPIVALVSAGYGVVLAGVAKALPDFRAQTAAVLALAVLIQFWMRDAGEMVLAVRPVPIGFGFLSLVAVSLFELGRIRIAAKPGMLPKQ